MIDRAQDCFGLDPERLAADTAYGSAEMLGWLVHERIPPVWAALPVLTGITDVSMFR
jgi:hypothetical protein